MGSDKKSYSYEIIMTFCEHMTLLSIEMVETIHWPKSIDPPLTPGAIPFSILENGVLAKSLMRSRLLLRKKFLYR